MKKSLLTAAIAAFLIAGCTDQPAQPDPASRSSYSAVNSQFLVTASDDYDFVGRLSKVYNYLPHSNFVDYNLLVNVWVPAGQKLDSGIVYDPVRGVENTIDITPQISTHPDHQHARWEVLTFDLPNNLCVTDTNNDGKVDHESELDTASALIVITRDLQGNPKYNRPFPLKSAKDEEDASVTK